MTTTADAPTVGATLTGEQVRALPDEATVRYSPTGTTWTRNGASFTSSGGGHCAITTMAARANEGKVIFDSAADAPAPEATLPEVDTTEETPMQGLSALETSLAEVKAMFATVALGGQQVNGVNYDTVANALEKIKIAPDEPETGEGAPVCFGDRRLIDRLPNNTILTTRTMPDDAEHTVFVKKPGGLTFLMGNSHYEWHTILQVLTRPDGEKATWLGSESEPEFDEIIKFKKAAWKVTRSVKSSTGWCGVLEDVVKRAGVTSDVENVQSVPLTAEEVAELPEGTVLKYAAVGGNHSVLYLRDDSANNPAKTRRIGGSLPGSWVQTGAWSMYTPGSDMSIQVHSRDEMASMPEGTVMRDAGSSSYRYVKRRFSSADRTAVDWRLRAGGRTYDYSANDFSIGSLHYVSFPGVA